MRTSEADESLKPEIRSAVQIIRKGGVVAIPTDTLYGFAACSTNAIAVERVFELKRRPMDMPVPLLISDPEDIHKVASEVPPEALLAANYFWPGELTIILKKSPAVPDIVTSGRNTVGVRVPNHWIPRSIVKQLGSPITGTSANRHGEPSMPNAQSVKDDFGSEVDLVIDDGTTGNGTASTLIDFSSNRPVILREGSISRIELEEICKCGIDI